MQGLLQVAVAHSYGGWMEVGVVVVRALADVRCDPAAGRVAANCSDQVVNHRMGRAGDADFAVLRDEREDLLGSGECLPGPRWSLDGQTGVAESKDKADRRLSRSFAFAAQRTGRNVAGSWREPQQEPGSCVLAVHALPHDPVAEVPQALRLCPGIDRAPFDQRGWQRSGVVFADLEVDRSMLVIQRPDGPALSGCGVESGGTRREAVFLRREPEAAHH